MPTPSFRTTIYGQQAVSTAGSALLLFTNSQRTDAIIVKALASNEGNIFVGDSAVTTSNGFVLFPGESLALEIDQSNTSTSLYIDANTSGDGATFFGGFY